MQEACRNSGGSVVEVGVTMGLLQRLEIRQGQSLVMTPQLLQAIKLLQLSHLDLIAYVEAELERNPLLERQDPEPEPSDPAPEPEAREAETWLAEGLDPSRAALGRDFEDGGPNLEATLTSEASLPEHLEAQLDLATDDLRRRFIGRHLIHTIDEAGYLGEPVAEIAARLGVPESE